MLRTRLFKFVSRTRSLARRTPRRARLIVAALLVLLVAGVAARLLLRQDTTLQQIQSSGVWRVGMDPSFPPFEATDPASGQMVGYDVDLAQAIAARWGVKVQLVGAGFDELIDAVAARKVDAAISALPEMPWRTKEVAFSAPYAEAGVVLAVPPGSPITGTLGLANRRVAVEWGSEGDSQARTLQQKLSGRLTLVPCDAPDAALKAVADGQADAAIIDAISLALFDKGGGRLVTIGPPVRSDPYVVVVPARSPGLLAAVNDALAALKADGTLDRLQAKWLDGK